MLMAPSRMAARGVIFGRTSTLVNDARVAAGTKRGFCLVAEIKLEWMRGGGGEKKRKTAWHDPCHVLLMAFIV